MQTFTAQEERERVLHILNRGTSGTFELTATNLIAEHEKQFNQISTCIPLNHLVQFGHFQATRMADASPQ